MHKNRTTLLIILDGFGVNTDVKFNSIAQAKAPTWKYLLETYPHSTLQASEQHVGLPAGFMGNSEVGHLNIGAGRVVYQDFSLISKSIEEGSFFQNPTLKTLSSAVSGSGGALHLMGLVSDGGVHSHLSHLYALLKWAKENGLGGSAHPVYVHVFTDGRDTAPTSGMGFVKQLEEFMRDLGVGKIATVSGRFYAMDRDNRWERTERAYRALVGMAESQFDKATTYIEGSYQSDVTDEFITPGMLKGFQGIQDGDGVIFFNFRADRARQITRALTQVEFSGFSRQPAMRGLAGYVCMTPYDATFKLPAAFDKPKIQNTLGELVSKLGWTQLRIAETEKYAHVTYFFNGGCETVFPGEKRLLIPSPREVKTYDLKPEMSAYQVTELLLKELSDPGYDFVVVNFANPDMVGHTGNLAAATRAVEAVDQCLGKIVRWVEETKSVCLITADHGNCEMMIDEKGQPMTAHTLLPVPVVLVDPLLLSKQAEVKLRQNGKLCDLAPTLLDLWKVKQPSEMQGKSLLGC